MKLSPKKPVSVSMESEVVRKLQDLARRDGKSVSSLLREATASYLIRSGGFNKPEKEAPEKPKKPKKPKGKAR